MVKLLEREASSKRHPRSLLPRIESLKVKLVVAVSIVAICILGLTYTSLSASAHSVAAEQARKEESEILSYFSGVYSEAVARDLLQIHLMSHILDHGIKGIQWIPGTRSSSPRTPKAERCT